MNPSAWSGIKRFLRGAAAMALGAAITYALGHVTDLPVDQIWFGAISALLLGLERFLRGIGWLPEAL